MDIDYAIRKREPPGITETSNSDAIDLYEKWERSNRLSVTFIKTNISTRIRGSIDQYENVKDLLRAINEKFTTSDKSLTSTLIMQFSSLKLTGIKGGMENLRKPMGSEQRIYSGSKMSSHVEAIGTCNLVLSSDFVLCLEKNFYVPCFSKNLISISQLSHLGFSFNFMDSGFTLLNKSKVIGFGELCDGLYFIKLQNNAAYSSMHVSAGLKRCVMNEDSSVLWHRRLGHISIERIKRLVNEGVLSTLDFTDFETCVDCIKGKQTNKSKRGAKRSSSLLEIIHTDIWCPDMDASSPKYFITFIDDYSRYMYLYLLRSKDEALDAFKVFKVEIELQCGKKIKIVRSDRGGKYYGRYTENGQAPGLFARFLQEHGIVAQYTMPGSPDQNGVAERRNRTLMDMVRSMRSNSKLPQFLWTKALKTTISTEKSKGYKFYCPTHNTNIVESRNAKFLENDLISGSDLNQDVDLEKDHYEAQTSQSNDRLVVIHAPPVQKRIRQPIIEVPQIAENDNVDQVVDEEQQVNVKQPVEQQASHQDVETTLRRSTRIKRPAVSSDYEVYLQESDYNIGAENDPETFSQAMSSKESNLWHNAMKD
ncbi:uncharacterized protein LOC128196632 [Vigna angularis]|uniref:uncharacterized protein LOC128196632 n=1 Tax=Phaseolus angularis TaxID=3914 RepID=UPI0022B55CAB|nr:uncharacterized protein LOC128196632 [Vigna angularis]